MALDVLAQGKLVKAPEARQAKNGNDFALAQMSVATDGDESILASLIAFRGSAVAALLALDVGDAVCVAGRGKVTTWTNREGESKAGLSITVEHVLTAYHVKRKREAVQGDAGVDVDRGPAPAAKRGTTARDSSRREISERRLPPAGGGMADLEDDLPFPAAATGGMR